MGEELRALFVPLLPGIIGESFTLSWGSSLISQPIFSLGLVSSSSALISDIPIRSCHASRLTGVVVLTLEADSRAVSSGVRLFVCFSSLLSSFGGSSILIIGNASSSLVLAGLLFLKALSLLFVTSDMGWSGLWTVFRVAVELFAAEWLLVLFQCWRVCGFVSENDFWRGILSLGFYLILFFYFFIIIPASFRNVVNYL